MDADDILSDIFGPYEHDGTAWRELRNRLLPLLALLPTVPGRVPVAVPPGPQSGSGHAELKRRLAVLLRPSLEEVVQAVQAGMRSEEWPPLSPLAALHLTVALEEMTEFLGLCFVEEGGRVLSLFPYSGQPEEALVLWMFHRWWMGPGVERWLQRVVSERGAFEAYFVEG